MHRSRAAILLSLGTLIALAAAGPVAAETWVDGLGPPSVRSAGSGYNGGKPLPIETDAEEILRAADLDAQDGPTLPDVGDVRLWPVIDDELGIFYLKEFTLQDVGEHIEVWIATDEDQISKDLRFPEGDCRNDERVEITDEQIELLIAAFDENIHPKESELSVPPERDGSAALLPGDLGLPADYYAGEGDDSVVLVDNVRDANFYDTDNQHNLAYIAGFFFSFFNEILDRNVMTIDGYDWLHRTGANPPNEPAPGDFCESAPATPFLYEGVFAHEYQHLLEYYEDVDEFAWPNEGLSDWVQTLTGYVDPRKPITESGFDSHVQCFLGYLGVQTDANPNPRDGGPENSLTLFGDQGDDEILCDYGAAYTLMEYLHGQYGAAFMTALHREDANGLAGLQAVLDTLAPGTQVLDVLHRWQAMVALDHALDEDHRLRGGDPALYTTPTLDASINWETEEAFSTPGAPPNGADYVRLRDSDGTSLNARKVKSLSFDGAELLPPRPVEWTVASDPPGHPGDPALYSGAGDNLDRSIVLEVEVPESDPTLTFETLFDTEPEYDFGFVQVSTDGGKTYTSLGNDDTTADAAPDALPSVRENLPGFNGLSGGGDEAAWITTSFDLSTYAGDTILLSFRYIADPFATRPGWWVDDVIVGGLLLSDGSTLEGWRSATEISPIPVTGFTVQLVGYRTDGRSPAFVGRLELDENFDVRLRRGALRRIVGARADVVAVIVAYDEPTESIDQYAPYVLEVNGVAQPGG